MTVKEPYKLLRIQHQDKTYCIILDRHIWRRVKRYNWYINFAGGRKGKKTKMIQHPYARAYIKELKKKVYLHSYIMSCPPGMHTDHKNHQTLDCRLENLEVVTREVNMQRRRKR